MAGMKSVFEMVHISRGEIGEKKIFHESWGKEFVYLQAHLLM